MISPAYSGKSVSRERSINCVTVQACQPYFVQAMDAGGCVVGLMDGSVRMVSTSVSGQAWVRAIWPKDGFVNGDW